MKTLGHVLGLCLLVSVLQLAVAGLTLLLAIACVLTFVARPREATLLLFLLGFGALTLNYPVAVLSTLAVALTTGWLVRRRRHRRAGPLLLPSPPSID